MSGAIKDRRPNPPRPAAPKKLIQGWVPEPVFDALDEAAAQVGVSRTRYLEELIRVHCMGERPAPEEQDQLPMEGVIAR